MEDWCEIAEDGAGVEDWCEIAEDGTGVEDWCETAEMERFNTDSV